MATLSSAPPSVGRPRPRSRRGGRGRGLLAGTVAVAVVVVAAFLLGTVGRDAYRSIVARTASHDAGQPTSAAGPSASPAAAPTKPAAHAPAAQPVAPSSRASTIAGQRYLAVVATYEDAMAHATDGLPTLSLQIWHNYAVALRNYDSGLRAIGAPASAQPVLVTLLADDAQMEGFLEKEARGEDCGCGTAPFTLKTKIGGDVDRLRAALGLPAAGPASREPGH